MGRFLPPDPDAGDPNTVGGYRAVHARPVAFESKDGTSYSVEIVADEIREERGRFGAYLLFVEWRRGDPVASGHLESDYVAFGETDGAAIAALGRMPLLDAQNALNALASRENSPSRPWYEVMRDEE